MKFRYFFALAAITTLSALTGCLNDDDEFDVYAQLQSEIAAIDQFLNANAPDHIKDPSGIRIVIKKLGTGLPAQTLSNVNIDYSGSLFSDGSVFDSGNATGPLSGYISGWVYSFSILPVGSEATLYIPSAYAYGNSARQGIPANSTLVFDVNFKSMTQSSVYNDRFENDTTAIRQYLTTKEINATKDQLGIWYETIQEGTGSSPSWYDPVKMTYSFRILTNDTATPVTFNREPSESFTSRPVDYIQGVALMLTKMKEGGKARVYIPSGLAFGINSFVDAGTTIVPPNSNVIVDIELKEVVE